jgi:predicted transposase YbfD/YdcC
MAARMKPHVLAALLESFNEVDDPRAPRGKRHNLEDIIVISVLATICGADDAEAIQAWAEHREEWLRGFLELPHGIPTQDTYLRVLSRLSAHQFQTAFQSWMVTLLPGIIGRHVAIDGKTSRGSGERSIGKTPIHTISAYVLGSGLTLAQLKSDAKSNETAAMVDLIRLLEFSDTVVTIDAAGCYPNVAEAILDKGGDYLLMVKDNQPTLRADIESIAQAACHASNSIEKSTALDVDKGHGRIEERACTVFTDTEALSAPERWPRLKTFGVLDAVRTDAIDGKEQRSRRYFISSADLTPERAIELIRGHWGIENAVHWSLDVVFREDHLTARIGYIADNLSVLRKIAQNLLRNAPDPGRKKNLSMAKKRFVCTLAPDYLLRVLTAAADNIAG